MFEFNNETYELPKRTMALNEKIEAVNKAKTTKEAYTKMMDFVVMGLGKEKVSKLLGTHDINKVDLTELNILANAIIIGFDNKVANQTLNKANELANSDAITNIIAVGNSLDKIQKVKK